MTPTDADRIAADWLDAWNAHDLDRIMAHYAEGIEFTSPFVVRLLGDADGTLRGKEALRAYFGRALAAFPDLRFVPNRVYPGVDSLVAAYVSVNDLLAAEVMELDAHGRIRRVRAHYCDPARSSPAPP
jgi:ketosteroid isomerase-like protein